MLNRTMKLSVQQHVRNSTLTFIANAKNGRDVKETAVDTGWHEHDSPFNILQFVRLVFSILKTWFQCIHNSRAEYFDEKVSSKCHRKLFELNLFCEN